VEVLADGAAQGAELFGLGAARGLVVEAAAGAGVAGEQEAFAGAAAAEGEGQFGAAAGPGAVEFAPFALAVKKVRGVGQRAAPASRRSLTPVLVTMMLVN
jgi:hypothetical protein